MSERERVDGRALRVRADLRPWKVGMWRLGSLRAGDAAANDVVMEVAEEEESFVVVLWCVGCESEKRECCCEWCGVVW